MKQFFDIVAERAVAAAAFNDKDFIKNGLLHCGECGTAKQCRILTAARERIMPCMCKCQNEKHEAEAEERRKKEEFERVRRLRANGIQDRAISEWTFANDDGRDQEMMDKAARYFAKWQKMRADNLGLLLWGNVGTGKTYFSACIANALLDSGTPVLMTSFPKIINALSEFGIDKNDYIDSMNRYKLLVIDDLGVERRGPREQEIVYNVIDARYKNNQPLIVTTNLTLDDLKSPKNIADGRIYDRILEMCAPIEFKGESRRKEVYRDKLARAREFFA